MKIINKEFFDRKTLKVARDLVGRYLVRKIDGKIVREKITEVEAYIGPHDLASHSSKGGTPRTEVMHAEAGTIYIYFIYGMYYMLNIVTEEEDYPAAILIRATENYKGPGVLTRQLKITKEFNGKMVGKSSGLWFEENEKLKAKKLLIKASPRIGVDYAGPIWANKKYRFNLN